MLPVTSMYDSATTKGTRVAVKRWLVAASCATVRIPVGEPDAGNPHVRFDEREMETEQGVRC
jgi:hypothetical protein